MRRGFDQSEILAQAVHHQLGVPHLPILRRSGFQEQAGKTKHERQATIVGRFSCRSGVALPRRVLLVDDVVTTGNTVDSCAAELYQAGAEKIIAFSLASALLC